MKFLKAMLAEMNETMEKRIGSLVTLMEADRKTDRRNFVYYYLFKLKMGFYPVAVVLQ
jgi:hypothetical protein